MQMILISVACKILLTINRSERRYKCPPIRILVKKLVALVCIRILALHIINYEQSKYPLG